MTTQGFTLTPEVLAYITTTPSQPSEPPTLAVRDLTITYGNTTAVKGISFDAHRGEVLGILGHNGAGKSSTMRRIAGVEPPTSGTITVSGLELTNHRDVNAALKRIGYCPDIGGLIPSATPRELITFVLKTHNKTHLKNAITPLLRDFDLLKRENSPTRTLSHGEKRRVSVLLAVLSSEDLLILDEPFDGVDPNGAKLTQKLIALAKEQGVTVILSTHLQQVLADTVDRVIVINDGRIVATGAPQEFSGKQGEQHYQNILNGTVKDEIL